MPPIHVTSEIKPLKKVMLHRPGKELLYLTPNRLEDLLFDDIPDLYKAQKEHDAFAQIFRENGTEVVYLEKLMAETLDAHPDLVEAFLDQYLREAGIYTQTYKKVLKNYFLAAKDHLDLVEKTMAGVPFSALGEAEERLLVDEYDHRMGLAINPMPNLYFTRDPFSCMGRGVAINRMANETRRRETIYGDYIFRYHPDYAGQVPDYYGRRQPFHLEGGDTLVISEDTLFIGISLRTEPDAIQQLAMNLFFEDQDNAFERIYAFVIPSARAFMHLDTVFTMIDRDTFTYHPGISETLRVFRLTPNRMKSKVEVQEFDGHLDQILADILGLDRVRLLPCGGGDPIAASREQWTDGSNTLAIAPNKVIVYGRNYVTNEVLREAGVELLVLDSDNLTVGRGGPRCMSMPFEREA